MVGRGEKIIFVSFGQVATIKTDASQRQARIGLVSEGKWSRSFYSSSVPSLHYAVLIGEKGSFAVVKPPEGVS